MQKVKVFINEESSIIEIQSIEGVATIRVPVVSNALHLAYDLVLDYFKGEHTYESTEGVNPKYTRLILSLSMATDY